MYALVNSGTRISALRLKTPRAYWLETSTLLRWKEKWAPAGPFGRTVLPLDDVLRVIEQEGIFGTRV